MFSAKNHLVIAAKKTEIGPNLIHRSSSELEAAAWDFVAVLEL
jgi:hypothetical protein